MQLVQNPSQSNVDNLNNIRHEARRHFRNKEKEYLKTKLEELVKKNLYRSISDFRKGYQPRTNILRNEKCDLVADSHSILVRWRKHFFQLLNKHEVKDVRATEIHTAKPPVPDPSPLNVELAVENVRRHKSPSMDQIPTELFKAGGRIIR